MEYVDFNLGMIDEWRYVIEIMYSVKKVEKNIPKERNIMKLKELLQLYDYCKACCEEVFGMEYSSDIASNFIGSYSVLKKRFSKLYKDTDIISINDGLPLYSIINKFEYLYEKPYRYVYLKGNNSFCYKEEFTSVKSLLLDIGIDLYREVDVYGNLLNEYSCEEQFKRFRIKDKSLLKMYYKLKQDEIIYLLKMYVQLHLSVLNYDAYIIGMNLYEGTEYIDVLTVSGGRYITRYKINHIEYATKIVFLYVVKNLITQYIECR